MPVLPSESCQAQNVNLLRNSADSVSFQFLSCQVPVLESSLLKLLDGKLTLKLFLTCKSTPLPS